MQMMMFDPRQTPTATAAMLADEGLRGAIAEVRRRERSKRREWPYVETVEAAVDAWAVDDGGTRFVVVGSMVFGIDDLEILNCSTRAANLAVFARLDAQVAA